MEIPVTWLGPVLQIVPPYVTSTSTVVPFAAFTSVVEQDLLMVNVEFAEAEHVAEAVSLDCSVCCPLELVAATA